MNKQSNTYIITYATIMVVLVAAVLSFTALKLKPKQKANVELAKKGDILRSVGLLEKGEKDVAGVYDKYIKQSFLVSIDGKIVEGVDSKMVFTTFINLNKQYSKGLPTPESQLPVFVSEIDGAMRYIFPVQGTGLWGPIWGYVALADDFSTISGVVFDHASETPGLGAEIAALPFQQQFVGKSIFEGDKYVGIEILKGAGASDGKPHAVDAVSGGTITSRGVGAMLEDCLGGYRAYIESQRQGNNVDSLLSDTEKELKSLNELNNQENEQ